MVAGIPVGKAGTAAVVADNTAAVVAGLSLMTQVQKYLDRAESL